MLGEDFLKKLDNIKKYYQDEPEVDHAQFGIFKDTLNFLTIEDIQLLVYSYIQKHQGDPSYNLTNLKVIEDQHKFESMHLYLEDLGLLKNGTDVKLLLKIKKGEPAHYSPNLGVHVIPVYMRCEEGFLSVFIMDQAAGVICETRDGFVNMITVIESYAKQFYDTNYRIIKSSAINQSDARNCSIYSLSALHYFVKNGDAFFPFINNFLVPQNKKIFDFENDKIFHLMADGLPAPLVKMTNRSTLMRVNAGYNHEWMPVKVQLTTNYTENSENLHWRVQKDPVGKHPQNTLERYRSIHAEERKGAKIYIHNTSADEKMKKARKSLMWLFRVSGIKQDDTTPINETSLRENFTKIKKML